jgi:hypothetical protein
MIFAHGNQRISWKIDKILLPQEENNEAIQGQE